MRARKYIYLVLGILFMFNAVMGAYLLITPDVSWLMTCLFMLIIGLLFINGAYRVQKKINLRKRQALENAFQD
jgi:uncharacterized membrane-anchored protein